MPDTSFNNSTGWAVAPDGLESIVTRAPTHEPWPYHNQGISVKVNLENGQPSPPPGAPALPDGVKVTKTGDAAKKIALQQQLANEQAELIKDQAFRDKVVADNRSDSAAVLIEIDKVIADRKRLIQFTQQEIAKL
jgi:FtsP/CotA-like multicopper oxidase with cupredoxin domain